MNKIAITAVLFFIGVTQAVSASLYEKYDAERDIAISPDKRDGYIKLMRNWKAKDGFQPLAGAFCLNGDEACLSDAAELSVNAAYAYRGLYQAQRNLAYCLDNGCNGAITPNLQLSCAWRIVVLASAHVDADDTDIMNLQICLRKSNPMQIAAAKAQAARLFKVVYNKEISRDWR